MCDIKSDGTVNVAKPAFVTVRTKRLCYENLFGKPWT